MESRMKSERYADRLRSEGSTRSDIDRRIDRRDVGAVLLHRQTVAGVFAAHGGVLTRAGPNGHFPRATATRQAHRVEC
jgi:hypothetical protein